MRIFRIRKTKAVLNRGRHPNFKLRRRNGNVSVFLCQARYKRAKTRAKLNHFLMDLNAILYFLQHQIKRYLQIHKLRVGMKRKNLQTPKPIYILDIIKKKFNN